MALEEMARDREHWKDVRCDWKQPKDDNITCTVCVTFNVMNKIRVLWCVALLVDFLFLITFLFMLYESVFSLSVEKSGIQRSRQKRTQSPLFSILKSSPI